MSMFSTASSNGTPGREMVIWNGYRLTATRSIGTIPCSPMRGQVLGQIAAGEQRAVNRRVQRLDPAVEQLGKAGDLVHRR